MQFINILKYIFLCFIDGSERQLVTLHFKNTGKEK